MKTGVTETGAAMAITEISATQSFNKEIMAATTGTMTGAVNSKRKDFDNLHLVII